MSATGTNGIVSIAPQKQQFGKNAYDLTLHEWSKIPVTQADMGPQKSVQMFAPEVNGLGVPQGFYTDAVAFGGQVALTPRAGGVLGWLLHAFMGNCVTTADTPVTGAHRHQFRYAADALASPWLSVRRFVPGATTAKGYGEFGYDCKIGSMNFVIPAKGQMAMSAEIIGTRTGNEQTPSAWAYQNANFDAISTSPLSANGSLRIAGETYRVNGLNVKAQNMFSSVQDEQSIGDLYAGDLTLLARQVEVTLSVIYTDGGILAQFLSGSRVGEGVSPEVFQTITGSSPAFEATFDSPAKVVGSTPFSLRLRGNSIVWRVTRPPTLQANQLMTLELTGTFVSPTSGQYFEIEVINGTTSYAWPVAPAIAGVVTLVNYATPYSAVTIDNTLTFTSPMANLNGGVITVSNLYNSTATTTLGITEGTIGIKSGGATGTPLVVALDTDATPAAIQTALRTITLVDSSPVVGVRGVRVTVTDGDAGVTEFDYHVQTV